MATIPVNFDDAVEPSPLPRGKYEVQITEAKEGVTGENSKNPGRPQLIFTVGFIGTTKEEQNAPTVRQYISLPHPDDEEKSFNFKLLLLKRFLEAFKIKYSNTELDTEALVFESLGKTAVLEVELSDPDANNNVYNRLIIPRIKGEATSAPKR